MSKSFEQKLKLLRDIVEVFQAFASIYFAVAVWQFGQVVEAAARILR